MGHNLIGKLFYLMQARRNALSISGFKDIHNLMSSLNENKIEIKLL